MELTLKELPYQWSAVFILNLVILKQTIIMILLDLGTSLRCWSAGNK